MAPLTRSFSLPVSLSDRVSRLKVFSGGAAKDEVSDKSPRKWSSPRSPLRPVPEEEQIPAPLALPPPALPSVPEDATSTGSRHHDRLSSLSIRLKWKKGPAEGAQSQREENENELTNCVPPNPPPSTLLYTATTPPVWTDQASGLILGALDRGRPVATSSTPSQKPSSLFGMRTSAAPLTPPKSPSSPPTVIQSSKPVWETDGDMASRPQRAPSPFFRARRSREQARARDKSPDVGALRNDPDSDGESVGSKRFRPQASAYEEGDESGTEAESDEDSGPDLAEEDIEDVFDEETEKNTEANAVFYEGDAAGLGGIAEPREDDRGVLDAFGEEIEQDPLGEGPNVVVPEQPLFPTSTMNPPKRRQSQRSGLDLVTSAPSFARDRCTITITHGYPDDALEDKGKRLRRYVVLSDLSEESRYAVEWAIGTVARDGDEIFLISVKEDESKVDPKSWSSSDKTAKLKIQRERQQTTLLLTRQITSLLQRTNLHLTVTCQFLHAKNSRHMLLDLIDFLEPTMAIVGSRGLGKLKGILLGSTSHYLVQKSSVPVMVARRRLHRPLRRTNPANLRHSPRVTLAGASIEKTASSKQEDEVVDLDEEDGVKVEGTAV